MPNQQREAVKLMVSIVDRGRGEHVAEVFDKNAIHFNLSLIHISGRTRNEIIALCLEFALERLVINGRVEEA